MTWMGGLSPGSSVAEIATRTSEFQSAHEAYSRLYHVCLLACFRPALWFSMQTPIFQNISDHKCPNCPHSWDLWGGVAKQVELLRFNSVSVACTPSNPTQVIERANIHDVKGKVLVEFNENQGTFDFPRGRYSIEMYSHFMRMHGSRCSSHRSRIVVTLVS